MAISVSDLGSVNDTGTDDSSWAFGSFGAEASDRILVALMSFEDAASDYSISGNVVIGGVTANKLQSSTASSERSLAAIGTALVPTGASGSVTADTSESITTDQVCTLLRIVGASSATPYDTATAAGSGTGTTISVTIDCPAGGIVIATYAQASFDEETVTWTLANEVDDEQSTDGNLRHSVAYEIFATAQTGLTVTATKSGTGSTDRSIAVISLSPVAGYTLVQSGGSFSLTGGTNTLTAQRKLVQSGGSFSLTGGSVAFTKGFTMVAAGGSFSLTGGNATFPLTRKLAMAGGSFSLAGGDTGLFAGRKIVATGGLFSLAGGDAALTAQRILAAAGGSFALTGGDAALRKGFTLSMLGGSFDLAGGDIDFIYVPTTPDSPVVQGGHFGGAYVPRKKKWRKVESLEALDQAIRETMRPDLIVLKDGTVIPVNAIELDDEEILLLL